MNDQDYEIITAQKDLLEQFSKAGYVKSLPKNWLDQVNNIYTKHTGKITGSCDSCRAQMLRWLIRSVKEYEANKQDGQNGQ